VPALRERRSDVPLLAGFFADLARQRLGLGPVRLAADAREVLAQYDWPGNVRELENVLSRVALRAATGVARGQPVVLTAAHFGPEFGGGASAFALGAAAPAGARLPALTTRPLREGVEEYQRVLIERAVQEHRGNWAAAARALGLHRSNLHRLAQRLGVADPE
jgi:anaerobic nitric oxide reductase transcription regulator